MSLKPRQARYVAYCNRMRLTPCIAASDFPHSSSPAASDFGFLSLDSRPCKRRSKPSRKSSFWQSPLGLSCHFGIKCIKSPCFQRIGANCLPKRTELTGKYGLTTPDRHPPPAIIGVRRWNFDGSAVSVLTRRISFSPRPPVSPPLAAWRDHPLALCPRIL